jgi:Arc/MetJ-type ribon-helix-helix transcriptional regulator
MTESRSRSIDLPADILERVDRRVQHTEFEDASEYVTHVLEEVLYELEQGDDEPASEAVDERQVEERLESLGYLNE